jgi:hypothetical protein
MENQEEGTDEGEMEGAREGEGWLRSHWLRLGWAGRPVARTNCASAGAVQHRYIQHSNPA